MYSRYRISTAITLLLVSPKYVFTANTVSVENTSAGERRQQRRNLLAQSESNVGFDIFDSNHDGKIDREEYSQGIDRVQTALRGGFKQVGSESSPVSIAAGKKSPLIVTQPAQVKSEHQTEDDIGLSFWPAFVKSLSMIIATEIGDKTFFIAAVMSMRNDRLAVFSGAILALICMTILSSLMGLVLPALIPRQYTHYFGGILFLYFGIKLIVESRSIPEGKCSDELEEVEEELNHGSKKNDPENKLEEGKDGSDQTLSTTPMKDTTNFEKVFMQSLTLTFLAEWGDRSQIATIALAAAKDPYGVNIGAILGHSLCTGMAVIGGRMLAAKIEEKTITMLSGIIFLGFGVHALFVESV